MKNITYINAGAGSGKTYRLTEEMVDKVKQGLCSPSQIIASTFTTDAAADLKKNAREKFLQHGLYSEAAELDSAAIGTVHSIGLQYIKKYWYKLGLTASVETITDDAKMSYLNRTLTKVVSDDDIAAFRDFAETFGIKQSISTKIADSFWKPLVQDVVETANAFGINDLEVSEKKSLEMAQLLLGANGRFSFMQNPTKSENDMRTIYYGCIERIFKIAREWSELFEQFKEENGLIEFNDMESKFIQLLQDKEVQADISQSVKYVFVDEFQDSNPKQIQIFDMLSDLVEHSYWVGDPKQAIYGFRGCDTVLVQALTDKIIQDANKGVNGMNFDTLKESRRSLKPLVDTTSAVFTNVFDNMDPDMVKLTAHRTELLPNNTPALWHWEQEKMLEPGQQRATASKGKLFNSIARQIRDIVDGKSEIKVVFDKNTGAIRSAQYSDIAVLARSNADVNAITNALQAKDIPVVMESTVDVNCKELRLVRLLLNYIIDDSPLLKAEIAHLLFGVETADVIENKDKVLESPDFGKLATLKERLKTLPVSDIVKTLVVELDIINRCQKWGNAENRQRTLQAVIEDAKTFDDNAIALGQASSIEHYLEHLDEEGVVVKEGFFREGVRVLTYHRSKGLQWNIVILCSLDDDSLNAKKLKKRFVFGVNYVRTTDPSAVQLYSDYYLTCLPSFFSSPQSNLPQDMMNDIDSLKTYRKYADRLSYESQRLLYVGVTRARDYLITTSLAGKKNPMPWLEASGIMPVISGTADYQSIWGVGDGIEKSKFVQIVDDGTYVGKSAPSDYYCRKDNLSSPVFDEKYLSPSKLVDDVLADQVKPQVLYPVQDQVPRPIKVGTGDEYDVMGTCIHNIFATYRPEADRKEMISKAEQTVKAFGMDRMLPDKDVIIDSITSLYQYLEKQYGKAVKVEHEVPFRHESNGQVFTGEMDLLWYTAENECVLIDFKNFPGSIVDALDKKNKKYVGKYAVQLKAYEEALRAAGIKVKTKLIYYSVLGCLIEIKFE